MKNKIDLKLGKSTSHPHPRTHAMNNIAMVPCNETVSQFVHIYLRFQKQNLFTYPALPTTLPFFIHSPRSPLPNPVCFPV